MASLRLPERPDLDQLRAQARDLQREVRARSSRAVDLVAEHHPAPPPATGFPLSAAQLVLARAYGFASWARLRTHVTTVRARSWDPDAPPPEGEPLGDRFLRLACLTYSDLDAPGRRAEAAALLAQYPDLPAEDIFVAAAVADAAGVRRLLAADPARARATGGPYDWSPLLYFAYARPQPAPTGAASVTVVRALLAAGADPDDGRFWHGLPTPFTVLTGVFGSGERDQPVHPHAQAVARVLLEAGAEPNDGQALYNRMFGSDDGHLRLLFEFGLGTGDGGPWHRLLGDALDPPAAMVSAQLDWALTHDQRDRVRLLAEHGADITTPPSSPWTSATRDHAPIEIALLNGHTEMAALLAELGAARPRLSASERFVAAALAGDAVAAGQASPRAIAAARRARPGLIVWAAALDRPESVNLLVRAGFDVNARGRGDTTVEQPWETALHVAAGSGHLELVRLLLSLGADPTATDARFGGTPLDWARFFGHDEVAGLLAAPPPGRLEA